LGSYERSAVATAGDRIAPEPAPVRTGWLRTGRGQRLLAKVLAAAIVVSVALTIPVHHQLASETVRLSVQGWPRSAVLTGPDAASPAMPDPRLEPGSTTRLATARPPCPATSIGTVTGDTVLARSESSSHAAVIRSFPRVNPQGAVQVFDLRGQSVDRRGHLWYGALLPMRPNGTVGYIPAGQLRVASTDYRIVVSQQAFTLKLYRGCRLVRAFPIGLGKDSTPTPVGRFYIVSLMRPTVPDSVYGDWAYGLSAYSNVLFDWTGGGVIGIHGTNDPSSIGRAVSHGCVRMQNEDIGWLVTRLPLGTPVTIGPP